jgi:hypothetical protein
MMDGCISSEPKMAVVGGENCDVISAVHFGAAAVHIVPKIFARSGDVTSTTSPLELAREGERA